MGLMVLAGCNLDLETENYPYQVSLVIDEDTGNPGVDVGGGDAGADMDVEPDLGPQGTPELVITEILINTSIMDSTIALGELGEFVEIKNIGDGPADPRSVSMRLTNVVNSTSGDIFVATAVSQEQLEIIRGLKPIMPGEYFVFVRHGNDEVPVSSVVEAGKYYDFGRYGEGVPLSNSDERVLEVRYNDGEQIIPSDRVRWRNGSLIGSNGSDSVTLSYPEDVSMTVRPEAESASDNDSPDAWCLSTSTFGGRVTGSPGSQGSCD